MGEELLRQILRVSETVAFASHVSVKRIPVGAAEAFEGDGGIESLRASRGKDNTPVRGGELRPAGVRGSLTFHSHKRRWSEPDKT